MRILLGTDGSRYSLAAARFLAEWIPGNIAAGLDPETTPVSVIMTREVRTVDEAVPIEQALKTMAGAGTRRLIVTGPEGKLAGLVAIDDVLDLLAEEVESIGKVLRKEQPRLGGP